MTTFHQVRFVGGRSGDAPLTWGQQCIWDEAKTFAPHHEHFNLSVMIDVPGVADLADVLSALRKLVEQRESLRTTYPLDLSGYPRQCVRSSGGTLDVVERIAGEDERRSEAVALAAELQGSPFSLDEFPIRVGIITSDGRPRHLILVIFHLATDLWDLRNIKKELKPLLAAPHQRNTIPKRVHTLDQAASEQGSEGKAIAERSLRYWKSQLAAAPADVFSGRASDPDPLQFQEARVESPALGSAIRELSRHLKVSPTVVFLAITSTLLGKLSERSEIFFLLGCHNRFSENDKMVTGPFSQDTPMAVDLADADFQQVVRRVWYASLTAYAVAKWDPTRVAAAVEEVTRERGSKVDLSCNVNVMLERDSGLPASASRTDTEYVENMRRQTRITSMPGSSRDRAGRRFFLRAHNSSNAIVVQLRTDTSVVSREEGVNFLEGVVEMAVQEWLRISR
ncbi:condensation domain-containing protein [Streptomyces longwoodensis]|uniref:condensation domain-containing protein n=1 Tax=Streptomyces longwoodensis TaxID=68231 RepID=UPI0037B20CA3